MGADQDEIRMEREEVEEMGWKLSQSSLTILKSEACSAKNFACLILREVVGHNILKKIELFRGRHAIFYERTNVED